MVSDLGTFWHLAIDSEGNLLLIGEGKAKYGDTAYAIVKIDQQRNVLWKKYHWHSNSDDPLDYVMDTNDNLYITGRNSTIKVSQDGEVLWSAATVISPYGTFSGYSIDIDKFGSVYVSGHTDEMPYSEEYYVITKFNEQNAIVCQMK